MRMQTLGTMGIVALGAAGLAAGQVPKLNQYDSKYYQIFTDFKPESSAGPRDASGGEFVREAKLRIDAMAETYHNRTSGFSGQITKRLPFYLYSDPDAYYAAGGMAGTAGVFDGVKLMAMALPGNTTETWHVVQHEGFHQFVHAVIGGDMPIWVNEGLAEYFGEGIFTGDSFVTGNVPQDRLARVQAWIKKGKTISIQEMMTKSHEEWNMQMSLVNYDQAWSMIHFLAHADGGRYQEPFAHFITQVSRNTPWTRAWENAFGRGVKEFETKWRDYWSAMGPGETDNVRAKATLLILTSFYGRAFSQRQVFESFDQFLTAAKEGSLKANAKDWLPPILLKQAIASAEKRGGYQIVKSVGYRIVQELPDGGKLTGKFQVGDGGTIRRESVEVEEKAAVKKPR